MENVRKERIESITQQRHGKFDYLTALVKQYFTEVKNVA